MLDSAITLTAGRFRITMLLDGRTLQAPSPPGSHCNIQEMVAAQ